MNKGWCKHLMKCQFHHPKWDSEEHRRLQHAYNESNNRNWFGVKKHDKKQTWGSGWQEEDQDHGKSKWEQGESQGTARSSWQPESRNTHNDQQPKTYVYRDREDWHYIKMRIPDAAIASIRENKNSDNKDASDLLTRIAEAATEMLNRIHNSDFAI
jgi:hypothetical protein